MGAGPKRRELGRGLKDELEDVLEAGLYEFSGHGSDICVGGCTNATRARECQNGIGEFREESLHSCIFELFEVAKTSPRPYRRQMCACCRESFARIWKNQEAVFIILPPSINLRSWGPASNPWMSMCIMPTGQPVSACGGGVESVISV